MTNDTNTRSARGGEVAARDFIESCTQHRGQMVSGNDLHKKAVETIREMDSSPPDIYAAYPTWPDDIRKKLSMHDLRRMSGWAPKTEINGWRIDTSAGGPILVYKDCSVIEGEDARYVLSLLRDAARKEVTP